MKRWLFIFFSVMVLHCLLLCSDSVTSDAAMQFFERQALPELSVPFGISYLYAGGGNTLLVAGGVHLPSSRFERRGETWMDSVLVSDKEGYASVWDSGSRLKFPLVQGMSISTYEGSGRIHGRGEEQMSSNPSAEIHRKGKTPKDPAMGAVEKNGYFGFINYAVLFAYFAGLIGLGYYFSKRETSTDDFFLAGRRMPWWAAGLSIYSTQLSAITYMAIPAKVYETDWVYFPANQCIVLVAPVIVFVFLPFYRRLNLVTVYEYLEKRFNLAVRLFGTCAYMLMQMGRMAVVLFLPAIALSTITGINIYIAILMMGIVAIVYTVLGGIEAVIWTDVIQTVVLLGGAFLAFLVICLNVEGGFLGIISIGMENHKFHMINWSGDWTTTAVWVVVFGHFMTHLVPYTSDQTVVQRYLTTKDEKQAAKSIWTNAVITIPSSLIFFGIGTALFVFYKTHPSLLDPSIETDAVFPYFIVQELPVGISGLVISGLFAAAMSSLDSGMNSISAVFINDLYRRFKANPSEKACFNLARFVTVVLGVVTIGVVFFMASTEIKSLWDTFIKIIGLFGGSMAGLFMLGFFTRRAHGAGTLIGAISGATTLFLVQRFTNISFFLYSAVGIITCVLVGYLASILIPAKQRPIDGMTIYTLRKR